MKQLILTFTLVFIATVGAQSQQSKIDSLYQSLANQSNDTLRMDSYWQLSINYRNTFPDSLIFYRKKSLSIAQKLGLKLREAEMLSGIAYDMAFHNYPEALQLYFQAIKIAENPSSEKTAWNLPTGQTPQIKRLTILGYTYLTMAQLYGNIGNKEKKITTLLLAEKIAKNIENMHIEKMVNLNLGQTFTSLNKLDSALIFLKKAESEYLKSKNNFETYFDGYILASIGEIYQERLNYELAESYYKKGLQLMKFHNNVPGIGEISIKLSNFYRLINKPDSSISYANKALEVVGSFGSKAKANAYYSLSMAHDQQNETDSALAYLKLSSSLRDSLYKVEKESLLSFQSVNLEEQMRLKSLEAEQIQIRARNRTYIMLSVIAVFILVAFLLYKNNRYRKRANDLLKRQKDEIASQKENVEQALSNLKSTQAQLIQSEKMASLGELTAGIAHEIQNPLNFVNNFSEVTEELVEELEDEGSKENGVRDKGLEKELIHDIKENLQKINHHGNRASSIIKGMLEHSRTSTGRKELTDINALADEYLRLSYHGLRAKDKDFNAELVTNFDPNLPKIEVVTQDIGRVLLNLINNAFQACSERSSRASTEPVEVPLSTQENETKSDSYKPTVTISTKLTAQSQLLIAIKDNGPGIPDAIKDKIFQPFFTTKDTGKGTGLGLSLAYDIVKAHGGEITAESVEGEGSEFIIQLPAV
jgi:two-component system, NtrC family, sensor kinase